MLKIGDRVCVIKEEIQSTGLKGEVVQTDLGFWKSYARVEFDDWHGSKNKQLTFNKNSLKKIYEYERKNIDMVKEIKGDYRIAMVKFLQGTNTTKHYAFALFNDEIKETDYVLCDTSVGYGVAKVEEIISQLDYSGTKVTKEIICKVDFSAWEARKVNKERKENLKKKMDKMLADNQELVLYQALAEVNPEMKSLLEEYQELA